MNYIKCCVLLSFVVSTIGAMENDQKISSLVNLAAQKCVEGCGGRLPKKGVVPNDVRRIIANYFPADIESDIDYDVETKNLMLEAAIIDYNRDAHQLEYERVNIDDHVKNPLLLKERLRAIVTVRFIDCVPAILKLNENETKLASDPSFDWDHFYIENKIKWLQKMYPILTQNSRSYNDNASANEFCETYLRKIIAKKLVLAKKSFVLTSKMILLNFGIAFFYRLTNSFNNFNNVVSLEPSLNLDDLNEFGANDWTRVTMS